MPKKPKPRRYRDYSEIIDGKLYAVVNLRQPNGKYKKKRKMVETKTEAMQWALGELEKHKTGTTFDDSLNFNDFADWYIAEFLQPPHFEKGLKVSGVKDYERLKNKIKRFKEFWGERKIKDFSEYDLHQWKNKRRKGKVITATINRDLALLRTMFRRGFSFRKIQTVLNFEINVAAETERDRVLSRTEEKALLAACVDKEVIKKSSKRQQEYETEIDAKREHLKPVIIIALDTAMRKGEILTLTWRDIDFEKNEINLQAKNTKGQKARTVGMTPRVKTELETLYNASDKKLNSRVFEFNSIRSSFETACSRSEIDDLHFHDLRHTAITRMIRAGIPHTEVMKISGHSQMKTFMRYLNLQSDAIQSASSKLAEFLEKQ